MRVARAHGASGSAHGASGSALADVLWRAAPRPHPALRMCVVIPVRNEAAGLAATLQSLAAQRTLGGEPLNRSRFEILLLANNCDDDSAGLARHFASQHSDVALHVEEALIAPPDAHIGYVRKVLMDAACRRLGMVNAQHGIVASTDGDTVVHPQWLAETEREFESGADAVGGRILLNPREPIDASTLRWQRCDTAYRLAQTRLEDLLDPDPADAWPRHHQHFCASLAVSRQAYLKVGGIPDVRFLEDEALVATLRRADLSVRHSPRVRVQTSARRDGRAEVGLSWQLRQWSEHCGEAAPMMVEDTAPFVAMLRARRLLRDAWRQRQNHTLAAAFTTLSRCRAIPDVEWLNTRVAEASTFGFLWQEIQSLPRRGEDPPLIPVRQAIDRLHSLIGSHAFASLARSNTSRR